MSVTHGGNIFEISRERGWDWQEVVDFSASINPLGPAPGVIAAIWDALDRIRHYPEREPARLRRALANLWNVEEAQLLLGNGATELLHFYAREVHHPSVTLAVPVFSEFYRAYPDARCVAAARPEEWPRDGMLVVTQPNNPTGAMLPAGVLESVENPMLIDESFLEFTGYESAARLLAQRGEWYVLRSLTKFYALPGLRVGALVGSPDAIASLRTRREPWQVNVLAEEAALAAIADRDHGRRSVECVANEREWLHREIAALPGVRIEPSQANYLFVHLDYSSVQLCTHFLESKLLVRDCTGMPGVSGEAVRIAVRTRPENERLMTRWKEFVCEVR